MRLSNVSIDVNLDTILDMKFDVTIDHEHRHEPGCAGQAESLV